MLRISLIVEERERKKEAYMLDPFVHANYSCFRHVSNNYNNRWLIEFLLLSCAECGVQNEVMIAMIIITNKRQMDKYWFRQFDEKSPIKYIHFRTKRKCKYIYRHTHNIIPVLNMHNKQHNAIIPIFHYYIGMSTSICDWWVRYSIQLPSSQYQQYNHNMKYHTYL